MDTCFLFGTVWLRNLWLNSSHQYLRNWLEGQQEIVKMWNFNRKQKLAHQVHI